MLAAATLNGDTRGRSALEQMCREYHRPVFVVLRARGFAEEEAEDLTQEFFLQLFETEAWKRAERGKGRFRSFLLGTLTHMLQHVWTAKTRLKRGGGMRTESLEAAQENGDDMAASDDPHLEIVFDREWALRLRSRSNAVRASQVLELSFQVRNDCHTCFHLTGGRSR